MLLSVRRGWCCPELDKIHLPSGQTRSEDEEKAGAELLDKEDWENGPEGDHQSSPLKDPPNPTVPIREKSTRGSVDGAGVDAAIANGRRSASRCDIARGLSAMLLERRFVWKER